MSGVLCSAFLIGAQTQAEESPWAYNVSLDYNSHFMSYGVNVWGDDTKDIGDGDIFNPSASIDYAIDDRSGVYVGIWADINNVTPEVDGDVDPFSFGDDVQEIDVWIGYWRTFEELTVDLTFQQWYYGGETEGIIDLKLSYDCMFSPYVMIHNRIEGVGDQNKGSIYEVGGTLYEGDFKGLSYGFSVGAAFNFDEYHQDDEDGYAYSFIGTSASYVIFSTDSLDVDLHGGLTYYDTDKDNTGNAESGYLTANFGVGFSF